MADKANITPEVLKWARLTAKMSIEDGAGKAGVSTQKLEDWENGIDLPTVRQAESLAKAYRRPLALFFLPKPPLDFQPLQDFRRPSSRPLGTASTFIIREVQQRQTWLRDLYLEAGEEPLSFVGRFTRRANSNEVAADILKTLGIDPRNYGAISPIKKWITRAEANGIFVSRTSLIHSHMKLDSDELQGFALADKLVPFIFINSDDWDAPQLFTIVHELAHIWIAESGISNEVSPELIENGRFHPVELYCNEVAAAALIPQDLVSNLPRSIFSSGDEVFRAAKGLGVSSFAFLFRALGLKLISTDRYKTLKKEAEVSFRAAEQRREDQLAKRKESKQGGGPDYYLLLVNRNGHHFTRVVMDAYQGGNIQPTEASNLLNIPITKFPKLEAHLYA